MTRTAALLVLALVPLAAAACGSTDAAERTTTTTAAVGEIDAAVPTAATDEAFTTAPDPGDDDTDLTTAGATSSTAAPTTGPPSMTATTTATTSSTTTIITTTTSTVPTTTTTVPAPPPGAGYDLTQEIVGVGMSVEGRPIIAERYGTAGGRRVLVIGVIHGNEDAGVAVVEELRVRGLAGNVPEGVELWLVESMNPDGQAAQDRHNANQVDLNRNFPHNWGPIGQPGDGQYAGTGPASEPETQAMVAFIEQLRPDIALWYHQDANLIIPSTGRQGRIRARYAELTGLPIADCCDGGVYTGIAATWARVTLADQEAVPFIVELPGGELDDGQVLAHTDAVLTIAAEG